MNSNVVGVAMLYAVLGVQRVDTHLRLHEMRRLCINRRGWAAEGFGGSARRPRPALAHVKWPRERVCATDRRACVAQ
jgi:hypothetical protein